MPLTCHSSSPFSKKSFHSPNRFHTFSESFTSGPFHLCPNEPRKNIGFHLIGQSKINKIKFSGIHVNFHLEMRKLVIFSMHGLKRLMQSQSFGFPLGIHNQNIKIDYFNSFFSSAKSKVVRPDSKDLDVSVSDKGNIHSKSTSLHSSFSSSLKQDVEKQIIIHPSACVHPNAVIMESVEIGAFCTVGENVTLCSGVKMHPSSHVFGNTVIGERTVLMCGAVVGEDLPGRTQIGKENRIGHYAVVGVKCQDLKYKEGSECFLEIGNGNDIREYVGIHRSSKPSDSTVIGDNNLIMGCSHIAHDCKIGNKNIFANNTLLAGHVIVHDFTHTGGATAVHQFCHVGSYSFLAGGAMVVQDVPVFTLVCGDRAEMRGLNSEGLKRCGFSPEQIATLRKAYQKLFLNSNSELTLEERIIELENDANFQNDDVSTLISSIRASLAEGRRGICKYR